MAGEAFTSIYTIYLTLPLFAWYTPLIAKGGSDLLTAFPDCILLGKG